WARVRQSVSNFLTTVWRDGALEGTKTEEAFFVTCDRTTMTQDDIDNGRLIVVVGIAPVKPAEFVIFRIQQKTRDAQPAQRRRHGTRATRRSVPGLQLRGDRARRRRRSAGAGRGVLGGHEPRRHRRDYQVPLRERPEAHADDRRADGVRERPTEA